MAHPSVQAERILDSALELAENSSWEAVNLHQVAADLNITLDEIYQIYSSKDDLVEAWFDRADRIILAEENFADFIVKSKRERLHKVIMMWFMSMSEHRKVCRQMLCYKFEFGHIHLQVLGIMRISRTVQWFREAALLKTDNIHRVVEEVCITGIYLRNFMRWLFDDSTDSQHTSKCLQRALKHVRSLD